MELISAILQAFSTAHDVVQVSEWVLEKVRRWSLKTPSPEIEKHVARLAKVTDADIRKAAEAVFAKNSRSIPVEEREELMVVLNNLSRNVRHRQSFGSLRGSSLRSERLLELLLQGVEPVRHQNEPVAPGSPWILRRHLGVGSFGEVWKAENPGFPIPRAYKFFRDGSGEWLRREQDNLIAVLNRLGDHEHIVKFLDVQTQCPYPYLALEYVGGGSLEEWVVKDEEERPKLDTQEIIRQVVSALSAAHSQGIAHRDVKPSNILLTDGPGVRIKLGDFGLARVASSVRQGASQVASIAGGLVGTALYLPPEAQMRTIRRDSKQDDVFAVGVVWYQLVMGEIERPPYNFAERLRSKGADTHTIGLIERCLADPERRFPDARALGEAIDDAVPPLKPPVPGVPDVQHLVREYLAVLAG